jgi:hypothetical protein
MVKKSGLILIVFLFINSSVFGQERLSAIEGGIKTSIELRFQPELGGEPVALNQMYYIPQLKDSLSIRKLKFYISDISFYKSEERTAQAQQRYFLFNIEDEASMHRLIKLPRKVDFDEVRFNIGVDSTTQMKGAQGGDLDPMHGMYWTWQSGYINFKLEGQSMSCPGRNHVFQFHIGGFQAPFNAIRTVQFPVQQKDTLIIHMNLEMILTRANLTESFEMMSPSEKAMSFADQLPQLFTLKP